MKKIVVVIFCLSFVSNLYSQEIIVHKLENKLNKQYEFSSLRIKNDIIYLMSESCKQLFLLDLKTKKVIDSIQLKNPK
jgi:hypothetical protein